MLTTLGSMHLATSMNDLESSISVLRGTKVLSPRVDEFLSVLSPHIDVYDSTTHNKHDSIHDKSYFTLQYHRTDNLTKSELGINSRISTIEKSSAGVDETVA